MNHLIEFAYLTIIIGLLIFGVMFMQYCHHRSEREREAREKFYAELRKRDQGRKH